MIYAHTHVRVCLKSRFLHEKHTPTEKRVPENAVAGLIPFLNFSNRLNGVAENVDGAQNSFEEQKKDGI